MKSELSSLDIYFLKKELRKKLGGGVIKKVYQYPENQFLFEVYTGETQWLYFDRNKIFLTSTKKEAPIEPPSFCMFLRKHLQGQKIREIKQNKFDRILEILTDGYVLIIELFSDGNVILCDSLYNIIMPLHLQRWKDREVRPKLKYKYPPSGLDPFALDFDELRNSMLKSEKPAGAFLATYLGLGGEYSEEMCSIDEIDKKKIARELSIEEILKISKTLEKLKQANTEAYLYEDTVSPFKLKSKKGIEQKTFSEALDSFFSKREITKQKDVQEKKQKEEEGRQERIKESQKKSIEKFSHKREESKDTANKIYTNYYLVENIIRGIRAAIDSGKAWDEIKSQTQKEETPEAQAVKEIREKEGLVIVNLDGEDLEIDFKKSVEQNAERYYEESKKAKSKLEGAEKALENQTKKEETNLLGRGLIQKEKPAYKEKKRWYEKFKWFISSTGLVVIAGKDAKSNENVVKKHAETRDILFHADVHGAAFVLIKSEGKEIDETTIKEAAEFSAAHSKAWARNIGTADVYAFRPEQATKPSSLPAGSFIIEGERVWFRDLELKVSIGIKINRELDIAKVISGPVMAVRKHSNYFVTIKPGFKESLELSREIKNKLILKAKPEDRFLIDQIPLEEFQKLIPAGKGDIVEGIEL